MKTFSEFLDEAKINWNAGPRSKAERKLSTLGQKMRTAKPDQMVSIANRIKQMKSKISLENEKNPPPPQKQGISGIARGGRPQKPRDVVSSVGTSSGVNRTIVDLKTGSSMGSSSPSDTLTQNRYTSRGTSGGRGTNISRTGGTYGTRGSSR
jgi:hypothetical protein